MEKSKSRRLVGTFPTLSLKSSLASVTELRDEGQRKFIILREDGMNGILREPIILNPITAQWSAISSPSKCWNVFDERAS
jgi:hypothetical protein